MLEIATTWLKSNLPFAGIAGTALLLVSAAAGACGSDESNAVPGAGTSGGAGDGGGSNAEGGSGTDGGVKDTDGGSVRGDGGAAVSAASVNLGTAGSFVILAKSGITNVPTSKITGNLGVSPVTEAAITGFALTKDGTGVFSTTPEVTGKVFASDDTVPTPNDLTVAIGAMETAFTDAAGRAPKATELGAGDIGSMTLSGGVYKWSSGLLIPTNVTLTGSSTDVWIFQIAQNLTVSSAVQVILTGGALPKNIFWQVAGAADLDTTSHLEGTILCQTGISLQTGASINGRLLAQTAVTISGSAIIAAP
jgi:hypothetical protein